jgi:hypothetical protein
MALFLLFLLAGDWQQGQPKHNTRCTSIALFATHAPRPAHTSNVSPYRLSSISSRNSGFSG